MAKSKHTELPGLSSEATRQKTRTTATPPRRRNRIYTLEFKLMVLAEADACSRAGKKTGAINELLRRYGLLASYLTKWRRQRDAGTLADSLPPRPRKRRLDSEQRVGMRPYPRAESDISLTVFLSAQVGQPLEAWASRLKVPKRLIVESALMSFLERLGRDDDVARTLEVDPIRVTQLGALMVQDGQNPSTID